MDGDSGDAGKDKGKLCARYRNTESVGHSVSTFINVNCYLDAENKSIFTMPEERQPSLLPMDLSMFLICYRPRTCEVASLCL